ncbi:argonaute-like protein [Pluteus cervinus]|uniref:Argonaute-like protein n=1 Tax=Pluteus cervinus TaxID=181527 RepID=A0ACD3AER3_9AGAR|nr:argonaute-like protein [Pluteus cervinus]
MPPRGAPRAARGRGAAPARGGRGGATRGSSAPQIGTSSAVPITTIGVRRPGPGTAGRPLRVKVNSFETSIPQEIIRHYDVVVTPDNLPSQRNMEIMKELQAVVAPQIFTPPVAYDGRKNVFASRKLTLGDNDTAEFNVSFSTGRTQSARPPKVYKVRLTLVAEINPEVLRRFVQGTQSHDNTVLTAITAMNVVIRMAPSLVHPYNARSFFTERQTSPIGRGIVLWRGYFQSARPAIGKMVINVDISTGMMYLPGRLIGLCLEHLGLGNNVQGLEGTRLSDRDRTKLSRFLSSLRIVTNHGGATRKYTIKRITKEGANALNFEIGPGRQITVANYFKSQANVQLQFPNLICVETPAGAFLPLELCDVPPGQLMKKEIPPDLTKSVVEFATLKPRERLDSITAGLDELGYGQSEYVRNFGMNVQTTNGPLTVNARVLPTPTLRYGASAQPTVTPRFGAWNMADKVLFQPAQLSSFAVVNYDPRTRPDTLQQIVRGFLDGAASVNIRVQNTNPIIVTKNAQGNIVRDLMDFGGEVKRQQGALPQVIVVILPDNGNDIYKAVKFFGDVKTGCITQCLKASKCRGARIQYWANVMLKLNTKLGGINSVAESADMSFLTDPNNPTIVMGADVVHPAPGTQGRPSYTALVASVDKYCAKYIATDRIQTSRQEIIDDLKEMAVHCLGMYMTYREKVEGKAKNATPPKRLIFYRDGVSEGQFKHVLDLELPLLQAACTQLGINPKITMIIVGKRHHVRMFPANEADADRSGNCPAGTIIDTDVAHPTEFDFYLCSHSGLLGTSRPAHYSVLHDENNFQVNALQSLSFALCHVYARATRSVSIPAPVYYADLVCGRAGTHYDPEWDSERGTHTTDPNATLERHRENFKPLHAQQGTKMYFS